MADKNLIPKVCQSIPILEYTSIVAHQSGTMDFCTTPIKFERDLQELLSNGYQSITLQEYIEIANERKPCPSKAFCVALLGGYADNYTEAFPILQRLNVKASIFIATELVGLSSHPKAPNMSPHFGWEEAQKMVDSGFLNIYPLWHPFDNGKDFAAEAKKKIKLLQKSLLKNGPIIAFAYYSCDIDTLHTLSSLGIELVFTDFDHLIRHSELSDTFVIPSIEVGFYSGVLDKVGWYRTKAENMLLAEGIQENADAKQIQECCSIPGMEVLSESIHLPIDMKPKVRNYLRHAFPFSVLQAFRMDQAERLLLSEYIDLTYRPQYNWLDYHNDSYDAWGVFECSKMKMDLLISNRINIITYLINGLQARYYCEIWLDTYYIPGKPGYQEWHTTHGLLLYGYEASNRSFLALSYTSKGHYEKLWVPIECVAQGCASPYFTHVTLFRVMPDGEVRYDFHSICEKLNNYLVSVCPDDGHRFSKYFPEEFVQYNACLQFAHHIEQKKQDIGIIPTTAMYSYCEHKRLMMWRLCTLAKWEKFSTSKLMDEYSQTIIETDRLLNGTMKYNITHRESLLDFICSSIQRQNAREAKNIRHFI